MHLLIAVVLGTIGAFMSKGVLLGDIAFARLTLDGLLERLVAIACYVGATYFLFRSLREDRFWPWR